jgi:hypothetical protein
MYVHVVVDNEAANNLYMKSGIYLYMKIYYLFVFI